MRSTTGSALIVIISIFCAAIAGDGSMAAVGDIIRTIPSPTPSAGYKFTGATFAEGKLIVIEQNNTPALPSRFLTIDPADGTVLESIEFPFDGYVSSISYDGSDLWVCNWFSARVIYRIGLDGSLIDQFTPDIGGYFRAHSVNCEGDILWVGANALNWDDWTRLFKMTRSGEVLEWYSTTGIVEGYLDGVIDTSYPAGSNLFVIDDHGYYESRTIKRLSITDGSVTVLDEFDSPAEPDRARGMAFDGEYLWLNAAYPGQGVIWCLNNGPNLRAEYLIEQTVSGGYNPWIKGQTFTPGIGIDPDPGPVSAMDLTGIVFYRSSQGWSGPTRHFYLNIYDGDPVNGAGAFVGSSINSIDVAPLDNHNPMIWNFDQISLDYDHEYWALVSSTETDGGFDVWCGMRESNQTDPYAGGTSIAGISGDPGGYFVKPTIDLAFEIGLESWDRTEILLHSF